MKRFSLFFAILLLAFNLNVRADEGMWLPFLIERINYIDMQRMGLQLTAEEIYSVNKSSLKDAIVLFGGGCTASVISDQGLMLTNHHCGYGAIQANSSVEHDYLTNGFWAANLKEEIPIEGLTVKFLIRIEDVSKEINKELTSQMTEDQRNQKIKELSQKLQSSAVQGTKYEAIVKSFFEGNEFYLFVYQTYKDVRMVGAPPSAIGKFGGDTDNWMWPRHTGDFSLFRVYTAPDGSPASYSDKNIPMKPKYSLPVSIKGVQKNDFTMILGYPGSTERYLTSYGINYYTEYSYATRISIREKKLQIMREFMDKNENIRIKYSSKYAGISNYWKNFIGTIKALKHLKIADKKALIEKAFKEWVNSSKEISAKYGGTLKLLSDSYDELKKTSTSIIYYQEAIRGIEAFTIARKYDALYDSLLSKKKNQTEIDKRINEIRLSLPSLYKDYDINVDKQIAAAMLQMYSLNVPLEQQPKAFVKLAKKYKNDFTGFIEEAYLTSIFPDKTKAEAFLNMPDAKILKNDVLFQLLKDFGKEYVKVNAKNDSVIAGLNKGKRLFIAGLREIYPEKKFYPDANQTMRLSYGKVLDYSPGDAIYFDYYTTLYGVIEKEDSTSWEFKVPKKLKELYKAKDYGKYGENGVMKTCFLSNNDITGGNSGSPVINGKGELVGLAFDGNWEAMSGNICFEPELQRTINVDMRYVLFIIDKYAGAKNIISELKIIQ